MLTMDPHGQEIAAGGEFVADGRRERRGECRCVCNAVKLHRLITAANIDKVMKLSHFPNWRERGTIPQGLVKLSRPLIN